MRHATIVKIALTSIGFGLGLLMYKLHKGVQAFHNLQLDDAHD